MGGPLVSQTVTGTQSETLPDGTTHTVVIYSDGSRAESWTPPAGSPAANADTLRDKAVQALAANAAYLALNSATAAQSRDQVARLTRQVNAIIRLLVTDDTTDISDT